MPNIVSVKEFKDNTKEYIDSLINSTDEDYIIVANKNQSEKSFLVTMPKSYASLADKALLKNLANVIRRSIENIKARVSEIKREVRSKRK